MSRGPLRPLLGTIIGPLLIHKSTHHYPTLQPTQRYSTYPEGNPCSGTTNDIIGFNFNPISCTVFPPRLITQARPSHDHGERVCPIRLTTINVLTPAQKVEHSNRLRADSSLLSRSMGRRSERRHADGLALESDPLGMVRFLRLCHHVRAIAWIGS